jgi:tRNA threonylcarbamoyladenosine biosynthesis protein TsaB
MIVLGMDTSTPATTVGLALTCGKVLKARDDPPAGAHPGHATRLLALTEDVLARAGIGYSALERIAVGVGPGTFTGLRVGVATARGLAHSLTVELVGVSSLRALAQGVLAQSPEAEPRVLAVSDARRGEAFAAAYVGERQVTAERALRPAELADLMGGLRENGQWLAVGDGALRFADELRGAGGIVASEDSPLHLISAAAICDLGARAPLAEPQMILPEYCRRPDAEIALESAEK